VSSNYTNRQVDQVPHTEALASFPQPRAVGRRETAEQATYTYNAFGQRIGFKDSGTQTWTVYNGSSADANPYADFSSSGSVTMRYLDARAVDQILARTSSSGATAWYFTDKLGSVEDFVSTSGTVLDHVTYDSFGNIVT
jgi:hypothetical protein